ncbi:MAG: hypothetical protein JEY94_19020 [Melioribacteraceae bacterium]|nr:hypothetical protein [Melioribacteraceae bacterium]
MLSKTIVFLFITMSLFAQEFKVTFNVFTENVNANESVYIAGNDTKLGNWQPNIVKFNKIDGNIWSKTIQFPSGTPLTFKFTKGDWNKEAMLVNGVVPGNSYLTVTKDTVFNFRALRWKNQFAELSGFNGQITGEVKYHKNFEREDLLPRDIIVWLPPDYKSSLEKRFPVLYMYDGQNIIDPKTAAFGIDWQVDETADSLIRQDKMKSVIIVGINNSSDRTADYSPTPKGFMHMRIIVENIKPLIDKTYRTLPDRSNTAIGGSSMGGIAALMLAWEHTDVFSKAICMSPAFKIDYLDYTKAVESFTGKKKDLKIYIDNGGLGLEVRLQPGIDNMIKVLKNKGYTEGKDLKIIIDKNAEHNEAAWAKRIDEALLYMFGK